MGKNVELVVYPPKRTLYEMLANPLGSPPATGLEMLVQRPEARLIDRATALAIARHVVEGFLSGIHRSPYFGQSVEFVQHRLVRRLLVADGEEGRHTALSHGGPE